MPLGAHDAPPSLERMTPPLVPASTWPFTRQRWRTLRGSTPAPGLVCPWASARKIPWAVPIRSSMIPSAVSRLTGRARGAARPPGRGRSVAALGADDADEGHAFARGAAEVVREGEVATAPHAGDLSLARLAAHLQPALEEHAQPGGADGMAERLEPPVRIHG